MRYTSLRLCLTLLLTVAASHAAVVEFSTPLLPEASGATGNGFATVLFDTVAQTLDISTSWAGLSGTTTVAHIHCCTAAAFAGTAGVAVTPSTLPGFPSGLMAGNYDITIDLSLTGSYTAAFRGTDSPEMASARLLQAMQDGKTYLNIHSSTFPAGEIRGFLVETPEPGTFVLAGLALAGVGLIRRVRVVG